MSDYLCHSCAADLGYPQSVQTDSVLGSSKQTEKFVKHTMEGAGSTYDVNSVFASGSTQQYMDWVINSAASGAVEMDDEGRQNFIWYAGEQTGARYRDGKFDVTTDMVKLVKPWDEDEIHAYPVSSTGYQEARCDRCGRPIIK